MGCRGHRGDLGCGCVVGRAVGLPSPRGHRPEGDLTVSSTVATSTIPVIEANGLGIRFNRNQGKKRRKRRLKDIFTGHSPARPAKKDFWALRDVSFSVQEGEAVGLVGGNGHGKSTLLKLIAGVLLPDEGKVAVRGGVAPLIEITGGFVGELTARDNIWLTAGLHGLSKRQ